MKTVAFVPARGGSKSIPGKNAKKLAGRPLIQWCLLALEACDEIETIILATDCPAIEDAAQSADIKKLKIYHRHPENATDEASTESVVLEYLGGISCQLDDQDELLLVQATSPLTKASDFQMGLQYFRRNHLDSLLTGVRVHRFFWSEDGQSLNYDPKNRPRRQDFLGSLMENGAFYIAKVGGWRKHKNRLHDRIGIYEMHPEHAIEADDLEDWIKLESLLAKRISI